MGCRCVSSFGIVLCMFAVTIILFLGTACSASTTSSSQGETGTQSAASSASASPATASATSADAASENASASEPIDYVANYVGTWDMVFVKFPEESFDEAQLAAARKKGIDSFVVLEEDGVGSLTLGDEVREFEWEPANDSGILIKLGDSWVSMTLQEDKLVTNDLVLRRGEPRTQSQAVSGEGNSKKEEGAEGSEEAPADDGSEAADRGEVSPDLKEFLDSYEAFMDEYVEFMGNYENSDDMLGMLQDYTDIMNRYSDFTQKLGALDTSNMSSADYAYYIEVTGRVSAKLVDAAL